MAKSRQIWITRSGRAEAALVMAAARLGNDLDDTELARRMIDEWYTIEIGQRILIDPKRLLANVLEEVLKTYSDVTTPEEALVRLINGWFIDRQVNSKRQAMTRIEERLDKDIPEIKKLLKTLIAHAEGGTP